MKVTQNDQDCNVKRGCTCVLELCWACAGWSLLLGLHPCRGAISVLMAARWFRQ